MNKVQQIPLDLPVRSAMGRDDFMISSENQQAAGWIDSWPKWPAPALIVSGPAASGKSHLAAVWADLSGAVRVPAADLSTAIADDIFARGQHWLIEELDLWIGDKVAETCLFHLYNMAKEHQRSLLITMRSTPSALDFAVPDLASRLRAAPLTRIDPPDDALLSAILVKLFFDRQLQVGHDVVAYILPRMERSFAAARDIVARADALALAQKKPVTVALMRQVLAELHG